MSVRALAAELQRRSPMLSATGWLCAGLLIVMLVVAPFDARTILGINPWLKPMKFAVSIAAYVWTLAWLFGYLPAQFRARRLLGIGIAFTMLVEIVCIMLQSARGVASHFNEATPLDRAIFSVMGSMIFLNTLLVIGLLRLFFGRLDAPPAQLWGVRLGLVVFLLGSGLGGLMVARKAHSVGVADGGPGLPLVNWSTQAGDLRIAHGVGLHGMQILPLVGWLVSRRGWPPRAQLLAVFGASVVYVAVGAILFAHAMAGRPLVAA
jgi:hypothetical protein